MHRRSERRGANGNPRPALVTLGAIAPLAGDVFQKKGQVFERFPALIATWARHDGRGGLFVQSGLHQIVGGVEGIAGRSGVGSGDGVVGHDNESIPRSNGAKKGRNRSPPLSRCCRVYPYLCDSKPFPLLNLD